MFKRIPEGAKSTESSSKGSSTEGRAGRFAEMAERLKVADCYLFLPCSYSPRFIGFE